VGKATVTELTETLAQLVRGERLELLPELLRVTLGHLQLPEEYARIADLLEELHPSILLASAELRGRYAEILNGAGRLETLGTFTQANRANLGERGSASVQLEYASALQGAHRHQEALALLEHLEAHLETTSLGVCLALQGWSRFELGLVWRETFVNALVRLHGLERARALINQGYCFMQSGEHGSARLAWREALPLVKQRAATTALIRYNLAVSAQRELLPEAEEHLLELERLTRAPKLRGYRARTLNALGMHRRALGEWSRAETAYREALGAARTDLDRRVAIAGWARVHYLSERPWKALEVLDDALAVNPGQPLLLVGRALALLAVGETDAASVTLHAAKGTQHDAMRWLAALAAAEVARRSGLHAEALEQLEALPLYDLQVREEALRLPALMALLATHGRATPPPMEYRSKITVRVEARGALRVFVNARPVPVGATSRIGELLVFLLERGGSASTEAIGDALYPTASATTFRKSLWALVNLLRRTLGWHSSVFALRGAYQLDPSATWEYDIATARARGEFSGEFLSGVYSEWALEVGRALQTRQNRRRSDLEMN
jgi:tetratricopeptide (TPR) repeat protein